jgi:hypothetical protein
MAEPDGKMSGPGWPPEWPTAWVTGRWVDIQGNYLTGTITLKNSATRAVATISKTAVIGGQISFPVTDGVPGGAYAQANSDGIMCIEFPIGTDPDVIPAQMQVNATEALKGVDGTTASNATVRAILTTEHTLDNPYWLTSDLTAVKAQTGVVQVPLWKVDNQSQGIPTDAAIGDVIWYLDTGLITQKTGA